MTDVVRRIIKPPRILHGIEGPPDVPEDEKDDGLLNWTEISEDVQKALIQQWRSRPWKNLKEFCRLRGLNYGSTRAAFIRRGVPSSGALNKDDIHKELLERTALQIAEAVRSLFANFELVQTLLLHRLMTGDLSLSELLTVSDRLSEQSKNTANSLTAIGDILNKLGFAVAKQGEDDVIVIEGESRETIVPPKVQEQLNKTLATQAELIVRQHEGR